MRHEVIPALKESNPQLLQNVNKTISYLKETNEIVEDRIAEVQKKIVVAEDNMVKLDIKKLQKLSNPSYNFV